MIISDFILNEIARVIKESSQVPDEKVDEMVRDILHISKKVYPQQRINVIRDKEDNHILECAVEGNCVYIVTGDSDLLALKKYKNIEIVKPRKFLDILS